MVQYFPIKLIKTAELDPTKNYLLGYHPHGIFATGAIACFGTNGAGWEEIFPGLKRRLITLPMVFWMPGFRESAMSLGGCSSNKSSMKYCLKYVYRM